MGHRFVTLLACGALVALGSSACRRADRTSGAAVGAASSRADSAAIAAEKPKRVEPCGLLTTDEAGAFLRGAATVVPSEKLAFASSCIWTARSPLRGLQVMVSTPEQLHADEALRAGGVDTIEKRFQQLVQTQLAGDKATPVVGLGDAALWAKEQGQLWIMKQNRALLAISLHGYNATADPLETCQAVASKVLARL